MHQLGGLYILADYEYIINDTQYTLASQLRFKGNRQILPLNLTRDPLLIFWN